MQDLKAGHVLGATPFKQQTMQFVGVIAAALVLAPVLDLLFNAWGFTGMPGADENEAMKAPQANVMKSVATGILGTGTELPWNFIYMGMGIGAAIIVADELLKANGSKFRMPVLAVAVGLYLPFELDSAILVGGIIAWLVARYQNRAKSDDVAAAKSRSKKAGLLFASGLITGEALFGILLAIPVAITQDTSIIAITSNPATGWVGFAVIALICTGLFSVAKRAFKG